MKKGICILLAIICVVKLCQAQAGNVGIGTASPGTKLDVNGAITNREVSVAVSSNKATIAANTGQVRLTGAATATILITAPDAPNSGQRLVIFNNTTGGFSALLNGFSTPAGQAMEYIFSNGDWQAMNIEFTKPQMLVVEISSSATIDKTANGSTSGIVNDALKFNNIVGASYTKKTSSAAGFITLPAGSYQVNLIIEGDITGSSTSDLAAGTGDMAIHSFFSDFPVSSSATKRIHANAPGNTGGASNFGVQLQYVTTITATRTLPFVIGWGQGGNVNNGTTYNFASGTQMSIVKIL